jgi:hypothetical protein
MAGFAPTSCQNGTLGQHQCSILICLNWMAWQIIWGGRTNSYNLTIPLQLKLKVATAHLKVARFYVYVTVLHRNKFLFNKINRRTNFPNLFFQKTTCFGKFLCPSSGIFHCTFGTGICHAGLMTYTSVECTVENSWWWAEELPETCRAYWQNKFWKLVHLLILVKRNWHDCLRN